MSAKLETTAQGTKELGVWAIREKRWWGEEATDVKCLRAGIWTTELD